ncbi:hypothetical protein FA95DRAFT_1575184 [Auriscalpium vulgare]|uniref:Uncharacterized protein n=1 Tax=Auriscalpium vulgare TaxID=40419 RepID=A0ACB8RH35_9AGAM|nr:hypothetical protein FA95DRAFT_1575184 [Auriscalpium vulgare]
MTWSAPAHRAVRELLSEPIGAASTVDGTSEVRFDAASRPRLSPAFGTAAYIHHGHLSACLRPPQLNGLNKKLSMWYSQHYMELRTNVIDSYKKLRELLRKSGN